MPVKSLAKQVHKKIQDLEDLRTHLTIVIKLERALRLTNGEFTFFFKHTQSNYEIDYRQTIK